MKRVLPAVLGLGILWATPAFTQGVAGAAASEDATAKTGAKADEGKVRRAEEVTVESASKLETTLVNAPATMSVVTSETIETSPAQNYADLLRSVPGMNVIQSSARDMNLTTRQGTSTLNNSQLVLVDGRSVYLDFFGLVLWDFVPNPASGDIKQIEVVRGPASVVWGANALSGVINILTKSPREHQGLGSSAARAARGTPMAAATSTTAASPTRTRSTTRSRSSSAPATTARIPTRGPRARCPWTATRSG
jgi:outer membrane receptor for ferrienterochelin and colicin